MEGQCLEWIQSIKAATPHLLHNKFFKELTIQHFLVTSGTHSGIVQPGEKGDSHTGHNMGEP